MVLAVAQEVLAKGLHQQVHQWNAHISVNGDYFLSLYPSAQNNPQIGFI
jgi:hypothetical protein